MLINFIYVLVFLIFSFLIYLVTKSIQRGIDGKDKNKKN